MKMDVNITLKFEIENNKLFLQLIPDIPKEFDSEMLNKFLKVYRPMPIPTKGQYKRALQIIGDSLLHIIEEALNYEELKKITRNKIECENTPN